MSKIELLDNITHADLRVADWYSSELGDNVASTVTFITEFADVQKEYPILFRKDSAGEYQAVVFFGIQKNENLFLGERNPLWQSHLGWNAAYVPAVMAKGPFSVGLQRQMIDGGERIEPVVHIDVDHVKVGVEEGQPVFLPQGGNSPYLQRIAHMLNVIRDGMQVNKQMFSAFQRCDLLEPVSINIDLESGDKFQIAGFDTIHSEKLLALKGEDLAALSRAGFLQAAYYVVASLSNMKRLVDLKNRRLRNQQ